jgi:membrane protein
VGLKMKNFNLAGKVMDIYDKLEQAGIINWPVRAAALSYYCILGLVPLLALCFTVAKSFGLETALAESINRYMEFSSPEVQEYVFTRLKNFADNLIDNYSGSVMAFAALGLIFWSGCRILMLMESAFGEIFGFHPPRRVSHRLLDYFSVLVIMPLLLMAAVTANIFFTGLSHRNWSMPFGVNPTGLISVIVIAFPYIMWCLVLSWAYAYFSRGLVRWLECLAGGLVTGLVFQLFQTFYLKIMFDLSDYNAIYGSFALVPLLLIGLYISWHIVLGGGALTRRFSDLRTSGQGFLQLAAPPTWRGTLELSIQVLDLIAANAQAEPIGRPTSFRQLSRSLGVPMPILGSVLNRLLHVGLILRVSGPGQEPGPAFIPAGRRLTGDQVREVLETDLMTIL